MGLSCDCDFDGDGWWYVAPEDFTLLGTKRSRKCCSCGTKIRPGDECAQFDRARSPMDDFGIEESIYGDEVPLASYWMCEECAGLFFSLDDLGYCIAIGADSMQSLVAEYAEMKREERQRRGVVRPE